MPFVFVAHVRRLKDVAPGFDSQDQIDDRFQRHVGGMWATPTSPAYVHPRSLLRQTFQGLIERGDSNPDPLAIIRECAVRRHHVIPARQIGIVHLEDEACVYDRAIFLLQRLGDGEQRLLFAAVIPIIALGQHAARSNRGDKCVGNRDRSERLLETGNVACHSGVADIFDRSGHSPTPRAPALTAKEDASLIVLGVELREIAPILAVNGRERLLAWGELALLQAGHAVDRVVRPEPAFAKFAVANDVDAELRLTLNRSANRFPDTSLKCRLVYWWPAIQRPLDRLIVRNQFRGTDQAADMGSQKPPPIPHAVASN